MSSRVCSSSVSDFALMAGIYSGGGKTEWGEDLGLLGLATGFFPFCGFPMSFLRAGMGVGEELLRLVIRGRVCSSL